MNAHPAECWWLQRVTAGSLAGMTWVNSLARSVLPAGWAPSTSREPDNEPESLPWKAQSGRTPPGWNGVPRGERKPSAEKFPCIGVACMAEDRWHDEGTMCQSYKDASMPGNRGQWQHMCVACTEAPTDQVWPRRTSAASVTEDRARAPPYAQQQTESAPKAKTAATAATAAPREECPRCRSLAKCSCFLAHGDERDLAEAFWDDMSSQVPRSQNDGTLAMPNGSKQVDLKRCSCAFPLLPSIWDSKVAATVSGTVRHLHL